jgi:FtsP/CotA-like multicopper oxidase with cupredoxin domain
MTHALTRARRLALLLAFGGMLVVAAATSQAAVPGITGPNFNLVATDAYTSQPDGATIYSWGYGCASAPSGFLPSTGTCPTMQTPGPTMIVTEGQQVTVTLTDLLPRAAGNTSIVFPGLNVTAVPATSQPSNCVAGTPAPQGLLAVEAAPGCSVTYTFTPTKPGTYAYYSGTQADLQIEMGMFGAIIVLPATPQTGCNKGPYALAASAYDNPNTCYDREYLFQFSEMNATIHALAEAGKDGEPGSLNIATDPYQPQYFLVNGRSMPDDMDTPYSPAYPHQPYNGNPHMHPGDLVLMRIIGQGRMQHPFHFHGNHARVLARDGNMLISQSDTTTLAGPLLFTTATVPGQTQDQIFTWTGQGLNWDVYGRTQDHSCNGVTLAAAIANIKSPNAAVTAQLTGTGGGYISPFDATSHEWCPDHGKDIPVAPPDPQAVANGLWYGGTPYLGLQSSNPTPLPPAAVVQNPNAGYAYMWHSHNEREITTNNVFPGGMMMMLIIDPPTSKIDETQ